MRALNTLVLLRSTENDVKVSYLHWRKMQNKIAIMILAYKEIALFHTTRIASSLWYEVVANVPCSYTSELVMGYMWNDVNNIQYPAKVSAFKSPLTLG